MGTINDGIKVVQDAFTAPACYGRATRPRTRSTTGSCSRSSSQPGDTALIGLTGDPPAEVPDGAEQAARAEPSTGGITGVVWRDFSPGGGTPGEVETDELGIPGVTVDLLLVGERRERDDGRQRHRSRSTASPAPATRPVAPQPFAQAVQRRQLAR